MKGRRMVAIGVVLLVMTAGRAGSAAPPALLAPIGVKAAVPYGASPQAPAATMIAQDESRPKPAAALAGVYGGRIVVADPALVTSKQLAPAIEDLRRYLGAITGAEFTIAGSGAGPAIALSLIDSPQAPPDDSPRSAAVKPKEVAQRSSMRFIDA